MARKQSPRPHGLAPIVTATLLFTISLSLIHLKHCQAAQNKGIQVSVKDKSGRQIDLYTDSQALLIGVSRYTRGWPKLESVPGEINAIEAALKSSGFKVEKVMDPDDRQLKSAFEDFIRRYGYISSNRLLFYYSGHGYSRESPAQGYLVPADAPDPRQDRAGFFSKALSMSQINTWCREMEAKHALFLFDSCFSGTIFKTRDLPKHPPHITDITSRPVRQFISAGSAGESVPAKSVFAPSFVRALRGEGDIDGDGYVTGTELGMYLHKHVLDYQTGQTPQYGKIRDPDFDEGDFVFIAASSVTIEEAKTTEPTGKTALSIEANIDGAEVFVDGKKAGVAPLSDFAVTAGKHQILVQKKPGFRTYQKSVQVESGRSLSLSVFLDPEAAPAGRLFVETDPTGATVRILNIGETYQSGMELAAGSYKVEVSATGYEKKVFELNLRAGEDKRLDVRLNPVAAAQQGPVAVTGPGKKIRNSLGMQFVYIEPGTFTMGSPPSEKGRNDDERQHQVTLTRGYYLQATEVTVGQWREFGRKSGYKTEAETGGGANVWTGDKWEKKKGAFWDNPGFSQQDSHPVTCVSWNDAQKFIDWLNKHEGDTYRLPTEAEWEYAARAGSTTAFANGGITQLKCENDPKLDAMGWYCGNSGSKTHPVGEKRPNAWGLYDMHGNVWEWCQDWYGDYPSAAVTDPTGPSGGSVRVNRGGSWFYGARVCRGAYRSRHEPGKRGGGLGLRLARNP